MPTADASSVPPPRPGAEWLALRGRLGAMIAAFPWAGSSFGPLEQWPDHLRHAVNLMLRSSAPMAIVWGRDFRLLYNDAYAAIIQHKHPAALGATAREIFPEAWPVLEALFAKVYAGEGLVIEDQALDLNRDGALKPAYFSFNYTPLANAAGGIDGFLAIVVETTARVVQERERAQAFDTVLSAITDFAYTFDRDGRFLYVNKALLDLWGLPLADAVGKNFYDLKYPDDLAERLQYQIQEVIATRATVRDETRYVSPTGVDAYYEYIFSPVFGADGAVTIVAGSTRDITSRKKLELEALAASKAKDEFLATLSHELRTPLNPVLLIATEAAANPELPAGIRGDFQAIADQVMLEARLIDDLLDISRIIHDKLALARRPVDLEAVLLRALAAVEAERTEKKQVLVKKLEAPGTIVEGDEARLLQVFGNLLRNAVKFTPAGGRITLQMHVPAASPGAAVVEISDSGHGLTADELTRVFRPFAQGEHMHEGSSRFGGLGLGLAISRKITELHRGTISVHSGGRDQGARFVVELPVKSTSPSAPMPAGGSASASPFARAGLRVLLVEDHDPSRQTLARILGARKIECVQAATAAGALAEAERQTFDVVLSDLGLPDESGYELMAKLRAAHGLTGIALSGYGMEEDIARSKAAGFTTHLTKPVQAQALDAALALFPHRE